MSKKARKRADQHRQQHVRLPATAEHERGRSCTGIATFFKVPPRAVQKWVKAVAAGSKAVLARTPTLTLAANCKLSINLVASTTNRGTLRAMLDEGTMDSTRLITFLQRLLRDTPRKVCLIIDNLRVDQWVAKRPGRIALFHLPAYSPELNPDAYLSHSLKRSVHRRRMPRNQGELTDNARAFLTKWQRAPARVKAFFRHEKVRYAS